jgi:hypothetical protein
MTSTVASTCSAAGTYPVTLSGGSASNYTIEDNNGTLAIDPALLTVKTNDTTINDDSPLPQFTSTITGFTSCDNSSDIVSGPVYSVSPKFAKEQPGIDYTVTPSGLVLKVPGNYTITYLSGNMYDNEEQGSQVTTKLNCVQALTNDPSGFPYVAQFSYTNPNFNTVFVQYGMNNMITTSGSGQFSGQPPVAFPPGTGTFNVYFNGATITWSLTTYSHERDNATSTASASSTSKKCSVNINAQVGGSGVVGSSVMTADGSTSTDTTVVNPVASAYPNPTTGLINIVVGSKAVSPSDVLVYNSSGILVAAKVTGSGTVGRFVLDLSGQVPGVYFVKVKMDVDVKMFRVIKL